MIRPQVRSVALAAWERMVAECARIASVIQPNSWAISLYEAGRQKSPPLTVRSPAYSRRGMRSKGRRLLSPNSVPADFFDVGLRVYWHSVELFGMVGKMTNIPSELRR